MYRFVLVGSEDQSGRGSARSSGLESSGGSSKVRRVAWRGPAAASASAS